MTSAEEREGQILHMKFSLLFTRSITKQLYDIVWKSYVLVSNPVMSWLEKTVFSLEPPGRRETKSHSAASIFTIFKNLSLAGPSTFRR